MTTLINVITIAIVLLFSLCVYIESSYWYISKSVVRKTDEAPTSERKKIGAVVAGFLFTAGMWIGVSVLILIPVGLMHAFNDEYYLLYERYEALWWTLIVILEIGILWFFYFQGLIKRCKQILLGPCDNQLFGINPHDPILSILWIFCLIIVAYIAMNITDGGYESIIHSGITSATAMLGLLIIYRTRKSKKDE
ncbi:hypothetical protein [uncultured Alistipes sp.]|uniref:hypothetical protein n=1 Tax=uncultured Alistipes sp. TaxID=538949 RepID=UPI002639CDDB|nr:hypothetical protein [uncultured Alistipes sp.]